MSSGQMELTVVKKLRSLGAAADGFRPLGVRVDRINRSIPWADFESVEQAVKQAAQSEDVPVEKCGANNFRLVGREAGKEFERNNHPNGYWFSP